MYPGESIACRLGDNKHHFTDPPSTRFPTPRSSPPALLEAFPLVLLVLAALALVVIIVRHQIAALELEIVALAEEAATTMVLPAFPRIPLTTLSMLNQSNKVDLGRD